MSEAHCTETAPSTKTVGCNNQSAKPFCRPCFLLLPEHVRLKLQIGGRKVQRDPDDRTAVERYAKTIRDAQKLLADKAMGN